MILVKFNRDYILKNYKKSPISLVLVKAEISTSPPNSTVSSSIYSEWTVDYADPHTNAYTLKYHHPHAECKRCALITSRGQGYWSFDTGVTRDSGPSRDMFGVFISVPDEYVVFEDLEVVNNLSFYSL